MADINLNLKLSPQIDAKQLNVILNALKNALGKLGDDIKLIDQQQLDREMAALNQGMQKAATTVKQTTTEADKMGAAFKKAADKGSMLGKAFAFNQVAQSFQMISGSLNQFVQPFIELDKQVQNIGTLGVKNLETIKQASSELAVEVPGDASVVANALYQLVSAGTAKVNDGMLEMSSSMKFVEVAAKDAVSGLSDVSTATDLYTSVLNAYGLSAKDVDTVSNATFATIKLGKTTFEELSASTATWLPTAASLKLDLKEVYNSIAKMTAMGTPTAQAATQIRAALVLIQKGGPGLNKALKQTGRSLEDFKVMLDKPVEQGGGFVNVLNEIKRSPMKQASPCQQQLVVSKLLTQSCN
jgi:TP901 family phage tail tape measure protein